MNRNRGSSPQDKDPVGSQRGNSPVTQTEDSGPPNPKGVGSVSKITTFLRGSYRVITNRMSESEVAAYEASLVTRRPQTIEGDIPVMAVQTGEWVYSLLENKLNKRKKSFRLGMISISDLQNSLGRGRGLEEAITNLVGKFNYAWANASYAFFLDIDGKLDFDLEDLGLQAFDFRKTPKRQQELTRITQINASGKMETLDYFVYQHAEGEHPLMYDGPIFVRRSFMEKAIFRIKDTRARKHHLWLLHNDKLGGLIGRLITDIGLFKGHVHVVNDDQLNHDVVISGDGVKNELISKDGYWLFTAFRLPVLHKMLWDMQTAINNHTWLTTEERFHQDLGMILPSVKAALDEGVLPDWVLYQHETKHDDDGAPIVDHVTAYWSEQARKLSHIRWQQATMPVDASANILYMAYGSILNQMRQALKRKSMWVPMSNAFVASIVTHEALVNMGGFDFSEEDGSKLWFNERWGVCFPGKRFVETADLHDTWDQDGDQAGFVRIKLWSSNEEITMARKAHFVIPEEMVLPDNPAEAIDAVVVIRRPNSPGGYSIELYHEGAMPFMYTDIEPAVIDLADTPASLGELLGQSNSGSISRSVVHTGDPITRENAVGMIIAQMANPGVGSFANAIMVHVATNGVSFPSELPAQGNDIIDVVQQEADMAAFSEIKLGVKDMWEALSCQNREIDAYILNTRVPNKIVRSGSYSWIVVEGPWTRMYKAYQATIDEVAAEVRKNTFRIRQNSEFVKWIQARIPTPGRGYTRVCTAFFNQFDRELAQVDKWWNDVQDMSLDRFTLANLAAERSDKVSSIVARMVEALEPSTICATVKDKFGLDLSEDDAWKIPVMLYRWIVDEKVCKSDRIIFQGGKAGQTTVMDLLIDGILKLDEQDA